ncbi:MAG: radical SAM protein [Vallitaleaceae bacterium]|nr:radical SAM protein [Vallitaleaceae bacterium]
MSIEKVKLIECLRTWQGEGIDSGIQMLLCRFKYCNKSCSFCDTLVKMRISKEAEYRLEDLQEEMDENRLGLMITGGEPTIDRHFSETLSMLNLLNYEIANVESNGYKLGLLDFHVRDEQPVKFIYSPKIFSERDLKEEIERTKDLFPRERVYLKIVYEDNKLIHDYIRFLNDLLEQSNIKNKTKKVWLMPEGETREDLIRNSEIVFDVCEKYKFNFSSRNHLIFGFV